MKENMENMEIKRIIRRLWTEYVVVWLLAIGLFALNETGVLEEGGLAHDGRTSYVLQTATVLLTLCLIPVSLKMFSMALEKRVRPLPLPEALRAYLRWSEIRLALLAVVVMIGLTVYYSTLSSIGGLCALVGLLATLFCLPGEARLKGELNLEGEA